MEKKKTERNRKKNWFFISGIFAALILLIVFAFPVEKVNSAPGDNDSCNIGGGWAWSGYRDVFGGLVGIGWTSFTDLNQGDSYPYTLSIDPDTGAMTGYIWSDSIGWIKFGGLSGFPSGSGTTATNATLDSNDDVIGWARACSVFASGCSGGLKPDSMLGGWDGWIALSGDNWGVRYDRDRGIFPKEESFAWGGNKVVGWFNFVDVPYDADNCDNNNAFDYNVYIESLLLATPSQDSITHPVVIDTVQGTPETVEITEVTQPGGPVVGVNISFPDLPKDCRPDQSCEIDLDVDYTLTGNKTQLVRFVVTTVSDRGVEKQTDLYVSIEGADESLLCNANPNPVFENRPVEWRAIVGDDLIYDHLIWSGHPEIDGQTTQTVSVPTGYEGDQVLNAKVGAYDIDGNFLDKEAECQLQVLPDIYFEHI